MAGNEVHAVLERDWRAQPNAPALQLHALVGLSTDAGVETFGEEEALFYGSSVAEGICPNLHEEDADEHDVVPRRLIPGAGADGTWSRCEDCGAVWRLRRVG
jgi:hypothetical protein